MGRSNWDKWHKPERRPLSDAYLIFGCKPFGASTGCDAIHHGHIPFGDAATCAVCHRSGLDGRRELRETDRDKARVANWKPEGGRDQWTAEATELPAQNPTAYRPDEPTKTTRRQRRAATRWGRNSVPAVPVDPAALQRAIDHGTGTLMA